MGRTSSSKFLAGPRTNWAKWREARDRKLAKPSRNQGAQRMHKARSAKEPT